jgi:hypothetical protein
MFDRVSEAAERLATNVSRRAFIGRMGKGALGMAAGLSGLLAFAGRAEAGSGHCCRCLDGSFYKGKCRGWCWPVPCY